MLKNNIVHEFCYHCRYIGLKLEDVVEDGENIKDENFYRLL
jgi:hypothetical protein